MSDWSERFKKNQAIILTFENQDGGKLKIMVAIHNDNTVECKMNFIKYNEVIDIGKLGADELSFFLRSYEESILNYDRKLNPLTKLKLDLRVIRHLLRVKKISTIFFMLPIGTSLFGIKKLYSIDGSTGFCFAASFFQNLHMINIFSPKIINQKLPYLHILNIRYLNNIYNDEIKQISQIIKHLIFYIRLINIIIYFPLTFFIFHQHELIIQNPLGYEAISFYVSLIEIPVVWWLVSILFKYLSKRFISTYIIKI